MPPVLDTLTTVFPDILPQPASQETTSIAGGADQSHPPGQDYSSRISAINAEVGALQQLATMLQASRIYYKLSR